MNLGPYRGEDVVGICRKHMSDFSVPRLHCPGVNSEAKDMENCRYTLLPLRKQLRLFFAHLSLYGHDPEVEQKW